MKPMGTAEIGDFFSRVVVVVVVGGGRSGEAKRANRTLVVFQGERFGDDSVPVGSSRIDLVVVVGRRRRRRKRRVRAIFFREMSSRSPPLLGASLDALSQRAKFTRHPTLSSDRIRRSEFVSNDKTSPRFLYLQRRVYNHFFSRIVYPNLPIPRRSTARTSTTIGHRLEETFKTSQTLLVETVRARRQHLRALHRLQSKLVSAYRARRTRAGSLSRFSSDRFPPRSAARKTRRRRRRGGEERSRGEDEREQTVVLLFVVGEQFPPPARRSWSALFVVSSRSSKRHHYSRVPGSQRARVSLSLSRLTFRVFYS